MRLLNTASRVLEVFQGTVTEPYAILSHVWAEEEVLFKDMDDPQTAKEMKGCSKITAACAQAVQDRCRYIWIDTCCINKDSSAELSEAINSMHTWYRDARICYAYLADVRSDEDPQSLNSSFSTSKWFTRGWTLQELLAPVRVEFFWWGLGQYRHEVYASKQDIDHYWNLHRGSSSQVTTQQLRRYSDCSQDVLGSWEGDDKSRGYCI
jgi:hypothetical protein